MTGAEGYGPRQAFGRAAGTYDEHACVQTRVADELLDRLVAWPGLSPARALDLGAGTVPLAGRLREHWPETRWLALDIALPMLQEARRLERLDEQLRAVCGDAMALPLADQSLDLVISSFALQWCDDIAATVAELSRVLRPGGVLALALPVAGTLSELADSWAEVDDQPHTRPLAATEDWLRELTEQGFLMETRREVIRQHYPDLNAIGRMLRGTGAHHVDRRASGLTGRRKLTALRQAYERRREPPGLPVTWEVMSVIGCK